MFVAPGKTAGCNPGVIREGWGSVPQVIHDKGAARSGTQQGELRTGYDLMEGVLWKVWGYRVLSAPIKAPTPIVVHLFSGSFSACQT
jgi:hypothetical protein